MTDVLLVKPYGSHLVIPPIGLGYLATALKRQGIESKVIHCTKEDMRIEDVVNVLVEKRIDIIGVTCCSNDHWWLTQLAEKLKGLPEKKLIVGGPHATGMGKDLFDIVERIDYLVVSEGERSLPALAACIMNDDANDEALAVIPNLLWRDSSGKVICNSLERSPNLDELGYPDWKQMAPSEYARFSPHGGWSKGIPVAQIITTRGCPYACNYCAGHLIAGRRLRRKSTESIMEEIEYLVKDHGVKEIHIEDDNFTFKKDHVVNLCSAIRKRRMNLFFSLPNGVRLDRLDDEILEELQATGFYSFALGIESGNQETLKRMNKALDLSRVRERINLIRKYDFHIKGYFMLGYPGETRKDVEETIQFAQSLDLDRAYFTMYIPLPGTKDFKVLKEQGKIDIHRLDWKNFYTKGLTKPPYIPDGMTSEDLQDLSHSAYKRFYLRPKILLKMWRDIEIKNFEQFTQVMWNLARLNLSYFI